MKKQNQVFYIVKGTLYRNKEYKEEDLITINREFRNEDSEKAREEAFSYYTSILEVLLESIGLQYETSEQAEKDLKDFYFSCKTTHFKLLPEITHFDDIDKLLTISFCNDEAPECITKTGIKFYHNERVIKAFGYESYSLNDRIDENLKKEKNYLIKLKITNNVRNRSYRRNSSNETL